MGAQKLLGGHDASASLRHPQMAAGEFPPKVKASGLNTLACRREQRSCDSPADESHLIARLVVHGRRAGVSWLSAERQTATPTSDQLLTPPATHEQSTSATMTDSTLGGRPG